MLDHYQGCNENLGLYCYYCEDNPREWSLWREATDDADEVQLTPWMDLGPDGGIWVFWDEGEEYMLVLDYRDNATQPPVARQALMHLPSGRKTDFIFTGDLRLMYGGVENINMAGNALLILAHPHDYASNPEVRGAALYDRQLRELIGPCIARISPEGDQLQYVQVRLRNTDGSLVSGLFDYRTAQFVIPAEYDELFAHQGCWIGNRAGGCDLRDAQGQIIASYPHTLHQNWSGDGMLYAERNGLWGRADAKGQIVLEPYAQDPTILDAEPKQFARLSLVAEAAPALCLDAATMAALISATGELGISIKYEGVDREEGGDGMLDVCRATLPGNAPAILLEEQWGDAKFLVLTAPWRKLPAGTMLALTGKSRVRTLAEGGAEDDFLQTVFAQSIGLALD